MKILKNALSAGFLAVVAFAGVGAIGQAKADNYLPDLVVRDVDLYQTGKCGSVRSAIKGRVIIKNVGKRRARALVFTPLIKVYDSRNRAIRDNDIKINSLAPGEETKVNINLGRFQNKNYYGGLRKIIIHVDPKDKIRETNELNNTYAVRVPVYCR